MVRVIWASKQGKNHDYLGQYLDNIDYKSYILRCADPEPAECHARKRLKNFGIWEFAASSKSQLKSQFWD
ncbi:hypothetical protein B5P45_25050 [Phyllobacterium zundukense]|uniref:Uncharacterized protein n=1 Tax=Phyllobacterium zundukense TaxID=1867719 RepID=A0A2N9VS27_9HYPH|nr:hypothetical protein BLM14_14590 [Phyllobacterium zundukense]PIO42295.1 hypothetical protein B5P45_25050 [Phyllobacterium zundukense]